MVTFVSDVRIISVNRLCMAVIILVLLFQEVFQL